ncbi:MAG: ClpXP protease specificity-enhancing factor [Legionellales bacterium]|nr:ClpXP protease specificity-enhancing factor [Legionellales bacterium]
MATMTSNKPYLIRAMFDWIVDNELTPHLLVNAEYPGVEVPLEHVNNGRIVLNISPKACRGLHMENDKILFTARFAGIPVQMVLPPESVLAIYAKENGRGMEFGEEYGDVTPPPAVPKHKKTAKRPALKLVE